jgi:hypothetical protein
MFVFSFSISVHFDISTKQSAGAPISNALNSTSGPGEFVSVYIRNPMSFIFFSPGGDIGMRWD